MSALSKAHIRRGHSHHVWHECAAIKKADRFGSPPSPASDHENGRKPLELSDTMSGVLESVRLKSLFLDTDEASLRRWNRDHDPHN